MPNFHRGMVTAISFAFGLAAPTAAFADDETAPPSALTVSGSVALVTDYRFRGLSQSSGDPAIQGGISIAHTSGAYAGVWSSSTDFAVVSQSAQAVYGSQELDLFAGWTGSVGGGLTTDVGLLYYAYPSGRIGHANFFEGYGSVSTTLGPISGKIGLNYAWKQKALNFNGGGNDDSLYTYGELSAGIPTTPVTISGHLGYTTGALSPRFATGQSSGYDGGFDWNLGASYAITRHLSASAQYVGVQGNKIGGYSNDTVVGTLKLSF